MVCLNYEESEIQFYHIENLNQIKKGKTLSFDNSYISTLQFLDNLILLHNFERCESTLFDLKADNSDKIIFKSFPMTNYEILSHNKNLLLDLITVETKETDEDEENLLDVKIKYNHIEPVSMLSHNNRKFYEKNIFIVTTMIEEINETYKKNLYYVYFDPMTYYENSHLKVNLLIYLSMKLYST